MTTHAAKPFSPTLCTSRATAGRRHRCPACGTRGALACVFSPPAHYDEPAPRYFRCDGCAARFYRTGVFGRFCDASGSEFDAAFTGRE